MKAFSLKDLASDNPKIKYACAKEAVSISQKEPKRLYSHFDEFVDLLESKNNIFLWTALRVLGNLSQVDTKGKIDVIVPKIISFLNKGKMITANNAVLSLIEIYKNKPQFRENILSEILKIERYKYETPECTNVAIGNVLKTIPSIWEEIKNNPKVIDFIMRQTKNTRPSVQKRANKIIQKDQGKVSLSNDQNSFA